MVRKTLSKMSNQAKVLVIAGINEATLAPTGPVSALKPLRVTLTSIGLLGHVLLVRPITTTH